MADSTPDPSPGDDVTSPDAEPGWGRALDAAGIIAGIFLAVIVIDIWTDGRLISRRLHRGGEPGERAGD